MTRSADMLEDVAAPLGSNGFGVHRLRAWALLEEADAINEATGTTPLLSTSLVLAAWRGQEGRALELIDASIEDATAENEGKATALAEYAAGTAL